MFFVIVCTERDNKICDFVSVTVMIDLPCDEVNTYRWSSAGVEFGICSWSALQFSSCFLPKNARQYLHMNFNPNYYIRTFFLCSMLTWSLITLEAKLIKWSRWQVHEGICDASSVSCWHWNLEAAAVFLKPRNRSSKPPDSSHPAPLQATAHVQRRVLVHAPSSTDP